MNLLVVSQWIQEGDIFLYVDMYPAPDANCNILRISAEGYVWKVFVDHSMTQTVFAQLLFYGAAKVRLRAMIGNTMTLGENDDHGCGD